MEKLKAILHVVFLCALTLFPLSSKAQFFSVSEGNAFVDEAAREKNIGIEVEFKGLSDNEIVGLLKQSYPDAKVSGDISGGLMAQTSIGEIKIVIEGSAYKYENDPVKFAEQQAKDLKSAPREVVFPPVTFEAIPVMHDFIRSIEDAGAKGTTKKLAVSLQVNLEMPQLSSKRNAKILADLMRNYFEPKNREQLMSMFEVPKIRAQYLEDYSPGFMKKLNEPNYAPTPREFFDDFMYRQSSELLGDKNAWKADISVVRAQVLAREGEAAVVPRVMKMNKLRVSSLFLMAFPNDPLTKRVNESRWARPMPVVEFREFNNDFDLMPKVRAALGIERAAELFGTYKHDKLFSDLTGIAKADFKRMRAGLLSGKRVIRYVLMDPKEAKLDKEDRDWLAKYNKGVIQIQLSPDRVGTIPMVLNDGSVVWHRRNIHRTTLLGEYNPGLENAFMQQALENKLVEAMTFNKYAPGSFPETIALNRIAGANTSKVSAMLAALNKRFPTGWVMKGAWDLSSERVIITDKTDFTKAITDYKNGFEEFKAKTMKETAGLDPEAVIKALKEHPGFLGSKILGMLEDKNLLLVQQRRRLVEEFRVEVVNGTVLGQGSTIPRYAYLQEGPVKTDPKLIEGVETYAKNMLAKLPPELRAMPYALDIAQTEEGDWVVIETNPGGNSSFLEENPESSKALVRHLKKYTTPEDGLLSGPQQMDWIQARLKEFGLKGSEMYPGIELAPNSFDDIAYPATLEKKTELVAKGKAVMAAKLDAGSASSRVLRCEMIF